MTAAALSFIDTHRDAYGVEPICAVLPIAPSMYYEHKARDADTSRLPPRFRRDEALRAGIVRVWRENFEVYEVRKVWRQLNREGIEVARCTVARLMRAMALYGVVRGKKLKTTRGVDELPRPADPVNRNFHVCRPNALGYRI